MPTPEGNNNTFPEGKDVNEREIEESRILKLSNYRSGRGSWWRRLFGEMIRCSALEMLMLRCGLGIQIEIINRRLKCTWSSVGRSKVEL